MFYSAGDRGLLQAFGLQRWNDGQRKDSHCLPWKLNLAVGNGLFWWQWGALGRTRQGVHPIYNMSTLSTFRDFTRHEWHLLLRFAQGYPYLALVAGLQFFLLTSTHESLQIPSKNRPYSLHLHCDQYFFCGNKFMSCFQGTFLMHLIWPTFPSSRPALGPYWALQQHLFFPVSLLSGKQFGSG